MSYLLCLTLVCSMALFQSGGIAWATPPWTVRTPPQTTYEYDGARYGAGVWLAPGSNGAFAKSTDNGATWSALTTAGGGEAWYDAWYTGSTWVIVGDGGSIKTSTNLSSWSVATSNTGHDLWSIASDGTTLVAVGGSVFFATSNTSEIVTAPASNPAVWTERTQSAGQDLQSVTYGGGQFVAVGNGGTVYTSPDGSTWTRRTSGVSATLYGVTYGNGMYVATGDSGTIITSTDGISWTTRRTGSEIMYSPAYAGGTFVAVGTGGTILSSTNGTSWAPETSGTSLDFYRIGTGNGVFVAVGMNGLIDTRAALSNNADLGALTLSQGTLSPAFASGTTSYAASVPYTAPSIGVTPTVADATATLRVNGTAYASGSTATIPLNVGNNSITVFVTAQDGVTTKTYTIVVNRAAPSTNANLSNLTLSPGTLTPVFAAGTTSYTATVGNAVTSINVTPTVADSTATITVNGSAATSGSPVSIPLAVGANTINVVVTAQDGTTQKTYTVTVTRLSNNNNLASLTLSSGSLSPAFSASTTSYTASVPYPVSSVNVTPTVADSTATLVINSTPATSGSAFAVALPVGSTPINVVVTAQDGSTKTYTITVTRAAPSTNANLSGLIVSAGTLSPAFAAGTLTYTVHVPYGTGSLNVTPTAADSHATLTVNGSAAVSGNAVAVAVSAASSTTVNVVVTAEDGTTTKTYTITIWPAPVYTAAATNTSQLVDVGAGLTALQVNAMPGAVLTFTLTGGSLPAGITLNVDGTFAGTATTTGSTMATIEVQDTHGGTAATSLAVTVQAAPAFTGAPTNTSQLVSVTGTPASLAATHAAGETLTFVLAGGSLPPGVTLNPDGTFSGAANSVGSFSATIQVADTHGGSAATTLDITVQAGPAFTPDAANTSQLVSVGAGLTALSATKAVGETLTFTVTGGALPAGITVNADGTFSGTAATVGSTSATIQAADTHGGHVTTTLEVTVQAAPAFTAAATNTSQLVSVGAGLTPLQATKATGETLTYTLAGGALPDGISLNANGTFSGAVTTVGSTSATIQVVDTHGGQATTTLAVTVQAAPAFTAAATNTSQFISTSAGLTALEATMAAGETLTFTVTSGALPAGITLNGNGTFSGTATTPGDTTATIAAADTHGGIATTTLAVTVQQGPAFTAAATNTAQRASVGAGLTALAATGAAGETLTFTLTGGALPSGITLNAGGTFTGAVTTVGATTATITVADTHGGHAATTLAVTVQAAPAFTAATTNTSQLVSVTGTPVALAATKAAGETLTFAVTSGSLPAGVSLNADGTFSGAITALGDTTATVQATDTHGGLTATNLAITVQEGPAFTADPANTAQLISTGAGLTALGATMAPGETLSFTLMSGALPAGITLNANGTFAGVATTPGATTATIQAADTHGGQAVTSLAVTVQAGPAYTAAATNTSQLVSVGAGLTALQATKAAGETLTFTVAGGTLPPGITLNSDGTFTGTATTTGATTATIHVADTHSGQANTTLAVTVQDAPAFTAAATNTSQFISTGAGLTALEATKAAGETLTFTVSGGALPTGITLNGNGTFSGAAAATGNYTATIQATDTHGGMATTTLSVTVQQGPAFTAAATNTSQLVSVGAHLAALSATKAAGETLTFTVTGGSLPAGIALNADGSFTGTVTTVGDTTATVEASDTHGGHAATSLAVTVQAAPAFTAAAANTSQLVSVGAGLTALSATRAPGETLTFTVSVGALPAGITLNDDGTFSGTVTTVGSSSATITAADTHGGQATTALAVTVQAAPAFTAAAANTSQFISTSAGLAALEATMAAGETLTFTVTGGALPDGISLNGNGTFSGTATTPGNYTATIRAADTHGGAATTTLAVTVQAGPAYTAAATNTAQLVSIGAGLAPLQATKAAGETLTFTLTGGALPAGISLNGDGTFSGTVTTAGSTSATIQAADTHGGTAVTTLAVTVQVAPAFTAAATNTSQFISTSAGLTALAATKAAGETLTFTLTGGNLPPGISLNGDGTFSGTATDPGDTTANIRAADTHGGVADTALAVTVQQGPAYTADATNSSQLVSTGAGLTALQATKAVGETLTFTVTGGALPDGITLNTNGTFSGTATTPGATTATIRVADTHGGTAATTLAVTVQPAPAFTAAPTNTSQLVSVGAGLTALAVTMAPGETLTFTVKSGSLPDGITLHNDGTFSGTVTTVGAATATIHVADTHGGQADTTLAVTVQVAPAFTAAAANSSQLISTSAGLTALAATAAAGETLTFAVTGGDLPAGISLNANGTFSGTATTVGATTATIRAADTHGGVATTVLVVTVQQGPAYTADATNTSQLVSVGVGLTALQATKAAGETLTFTVTGGLLPAGITLNADGSFSGAVTTVGPSSATIQAADTHGGTATTVLSVSVQPEPAFTADAANTSQLVSVGAGLAALQATKAAGETLTFTMTGGALPDGITLNSNGTFSGTVTTVGASSATIRAADTHGGIATTTLAVTVQVAPAFTGAAANTTQLVSVGAGLAALDATKATGDTLTFSLKSGALPDGINLNTNGTFSGTATTAGNSTATIEAADTHGGKATTVLAVTVQPKPAFTADSTNTSQLVSVGAGLTALAATMAPGETLTFTVTSGALPAGISLNGDGTFNGTVTTVGTSSVTIRAADTHGGTATTTLAVTVQAAPAFTADPANTTQLVSVDAGLAALQATKAAGETLTFTVTAGNLPAGISLTAGGTFSGTATTVGGTTATIQAADTHGGLATTTLNVTVQPKPAFTGAPANTAQLVSVGAGLAALDATKAIGETLTFSLKSGALPDGISLNAGGTFSGTATTAGASTATIEAADTHGGKATTVLAVTVQPKPAFTADSTNTSQLVSVGAGLTALQATKATGETLTFTVTGGSLPAGISLNSDGTFSGTVTTVGTSSANIRVADTHGGIATTTLAVAVQVAPAFTGASANTSQFISTRAGLVALAATKAAGETLRFTLTSGSLPVGISLNEDGTFAGTATTVGDTTAHIQVADTHGGVATTTLDVTVQIGPAFTGAATNSTQLVSVDAGLAALDATMATGETLTFSLKSGALPDGISLNTNGTFSGTATTVGGSTATVEAADTHGGKATTVLAVTVQPKPAFTADGTNTTQLVSVGAGLAALQATKATGETLTFTVTGGALPDGITLNSNGTFSGKVTTVGTSSATIRAADTHGGRAVTTLAVTVQVAPAFTGADANTTQLVSVDAGLAALDATKAAGETLTFALKSGALPDGINLSTNGTFTGTVTTVGGSTATIEAADTHGGKATTVLTVTVQPKPAFTAAATNRTQLVSVGAGLTALAATMAPGETLTFTVTSGALPAGISMAANGTFSGTATTVGTSSATIQAADTHGGIAATTLAVTVQVAPAFTGAPANTTQLVSVGAGLAALQATKATGETLRFTVVSGSLPTGISLNEDGTFAGTATTVGGTTATIQAADTHGGIATTTLAVTVQVAPAFTGAPANTTQLVSVGAGLAALDATKATGETLTFSLKSGALPVGINLIANGTFSGTVTTAGGSTATIEAADTHGGKATTDLTVTVQPKPAFTAAETNTTQLVSVGARLTALTATMAPGETLTFSITSGALPAGISMAANGTFSGTATTVGTSSATIQAADTHGGIAATTLAVTVQVAPAFTGAPANTTQLVSVGAGLAALQATKATGETLRFTVIGGSLPDGISLNEDGTFAGTATTVGSTTATIQAADTHGGIATTTLAVTVQVAPAFTGARANTAQLVSVGVALAALDATKATGETLTFSLKSGALPAGIGLNANGTFSGTVTTVGESTATIEAADTHGGKATTDLTVTVQPKPAFTAAETNTTQLVSVGAGLTALAFTKATDETLTFSITSGSLPDGIAMDSNGGFSGTVTTVGTTTAVIHVADTHGGQADTTLAVRVQEAPAFTADPANTSQFISTSAGLAALTTTKAAGETLTFTLTAGALPTGITLNSNGTFSGTATTVGDTTATIEAADTHGGLAATTLAVTVQQGPAFTDAAANTAQTWSVGAGLTALSATKATGETLTFTLTAGALPDGITLVSDGTFSGTVTTVGDTTATIQAADTHGGHATTRLAVTVQAAPAFTAAATNTVQVTSTGAGMVALETTQAVGETLTFTLTSGSLPAGISLKAGGSFEGTATTAGTSTVGIAVTDTHGGRAATTLAITVQQGPLFTSASTNTNQFITTGQKPQPLQATADAGQTMTFSLVSGNLPAGVTLKTDGSFDGAATITGTSTATIAVVDGRGGRAVTTLSVAVSIPTPPPALTVNGGVVTTTTPTISGTANLPDGSSVSVQVDAASYSASVSGGNWSVTVTTPLTVGTHSVTATGRNSAGQTASASGSITVKVAPTVAPVPDQSSKVGDRVSLGVTATGAPGSRLVYSASGLPEKLTIDPATGQITGNITKDGVFPVTVTVTETVAGGATSVNFTWRAIHGKGGGKVKDAATGKPVSGATVTLAQDGNTVTATTDSDGTFSFDQVNSLKTFTLKVTHPAYLTQTRGPLDLAASGTFDESFQLIPVGNLRISSPAAGAKLTLPPAGVSGTVTGNVRVTVQLNGSAAGAAAVDAAGNWQAALPASLLVVGTNAIDATAYAPNDQVVSAARVEFNYAPTGSLAGIVFTDGGAPAPGIALKLLDESGKQVGSATTGADGAYSFAELPVGTFTLQAGTVRTQVTVTAGQTTQQNLVVSRQVNLSLSLSPSSIVGDGKATAAVTLTATTVDGAPAAGVTAELAATAGSLSAGSVTTGQNGTATVTLTAPQLNGTAAGDGRVTATVRGAQGVTAEVSAVIRFVPASVTGRLVDGRTGKPLAGARVWVAEDFNGDGIIDFSASTTSGPDGSYTLNVPRANWTYRIHVSAAMQVGDHTVNVDSVQDGIVGQVNVVGETFAAERQVTGQILIAGAQGGQPQAPDQALPHGETVTATVQRLDTGETLNLTVSPQGTFSAGSLNPGQYRLVLQVTAPDGQKLAGTAVNISVNEQQEMSVQTALIDPYGTVKDAVTGKPVAGAKMTLMWADTNLNRSKGRTPDTAVALPALPDFPPNQNAVPQLTTADGQYAWMVFPQGDYYILAEKDGYKPYDSRAEGRNVDGTDSYVKGGIIHVGETIVSYSFQMTPSAPAGGGQGGSTGGETRHTRYIQGYPDGTFGPERNITRAEVATVLARLLGAAPGAGAGPQFTDVAAGYWAADSIAIVAARGLMVGDPDGHFRPNDPVTRAEVAVIVSRMRNLAPGTTAPFPDVAGHWAAPFIAAAKDAGILSGYPDGTFQPGRPTTRAEFVTIMNRTLQRGPLTGMTAPTFPDVPLDSWAAGQVEEAATDHQYTIAPDGAEHLVP